MLPSDADLPDRQEAVREAIYAAHALDWLVPSDALGHEALYLSDLLCRLSPQDAEAHGLSALIAFTQSRRRARLRGGVFVPLDEQDHKLWDGRMIAFGQDALLHAQALARPGRFQNEAAMPLFRRRAGWPGSAAWSRTSSEPAGRLCEGTSSCVASEVIDPASAIAKPQNMK